MIGRWLTQLIPPLHGNDRRAALHRAWGHVFTSQLRGAYYEFGVYQGDSFRASVLEHQRFRKWIQSQLRSRESWRPMASASYAGYRHGFYAFDTFAGIPANIERNITFAEGNFSCSLEEFRRRNVKAGIRESEHVRYFEGEFSKVKLPADLEPAAIVNIDSDLYASAVDALELAGSQLQQGTVLLMDDWNCFAASNNHGERRALGEFLASNAHYGIDAEPWFSYGYAGQAFIIQCGGRS